MEFLVEFLLELLGGILEAVLDSVTLPKWLRITLISLFIAGLLFLLIFAIYQIGWIVLMVFMGFIAFIILILMSVWAVRIRRYGLLRPAKKDALPQVMQLYRSVMGRPGCNWSLLYPNDITLQEDFRTGNLFVLCKKKKIIGAASIVPKNELDDLKHWHIQENAREIARIVIDPKCQGKSHGKYLVHRLCRRLRRSGCAAVHLLVSTQNKRAISLYRSVGFFPRGNVHRYDHDYYAYEKRLRKGKKK